VVDGRRRLLGVITASDVVAAIAESESPQERERLFEATRVREIMTAKAQVVSVDAEVAEAARTMLYLEVHRLFVVDGAELVGVISQSDISGAVATAKL
jgi:CBS domain-containing protein